MEPHNSSLLQHLTSARSAWNEGHAFLLELAGRVLEGKGIDVHALTGGSRTLSELDSAMLVEKLRSAYRQFTRHLRPLDVFLGDMPTIDEISPWNFCGDPVPLSVLRPSPEVDSDLVSPWPIDSTAEWTIGNWKDNCVEPMQQTKNQWTSVFAELSQRIAQQPIPDDEVTSLGIIQAITMDDLTLDDETRTATRQGKTASFTDQPIPWRLLCSLHSRAGSFYPSSALIDDNWAESIIELGTLYSHISTLNRKLECLGIKVKSHRGLGYRLEFL
jgi:hypothetical protein